MSNILKPRAKKNLNEIRAIKKLQKSRSCKELVHYEENINLIHMRSISASLKRNVKKVKDIEYLEKKFDKRFDKIEKKLDKLDEMNISINSLFLLSILREDIAEEKEKSIIRNYIKRQYKQKLDNLYKELPVNKTIDDEKKINLPNQNNNNAKNLGQINPNIKNNNNNNAFQKVNDYKKNPFINQSLNNKDNRRTKKKFSFKKKSHQKRDNSSNTISFENSLNKSIKSNTKSINNSNSIKDDDKTKNMKSIDKTNSNRNVSRNKKDEKQFKNSLINKEKKGNSLNNNSNQSSSKNSEKKYIPQKQFKKININKPSQIGSKTFTFKYAESMNNASKNKNNPFIGTYSKDSESSSSRKKKE